MVAAGTQNFPIGYLPGCRFSGERHFGRKPSGSEEALPAWEGAAPLWARRRWPALNLLGQTNEIAKLRMASRRWGRSVEMVNRERDMNTRRDYLKGAGAATGVIFCSCGLLDAASPQQDR